MVVSSHFPSPTIRRAACVLLSAGLRLGIKQVLNSMRVEQLQELFEVGWKMDRSHRGFAALSLLLPGVRKQSWKANSSSRLLRQTMTLS
jgi:hypothetical protein